MSTARTPIGKAFRGALNNFHSPTMMAHAINHAVKRAGVDGEEIDDVVIGSVLNAGTSGENVARLSVFAAGLPVRVAARGPRDYLKSNKEMFDPKSVPATNWLIKYRPIGIAEVAAGDGALQTCMIRFDLRIRKSCTSVPSANTA